MTIRRVIWLPALCLSLAACSSSPMSPTGPTGLATGIGLQPFSIADQPPVGNPAISCPSAAPSEFRVRENGASTGAELEWRREFNVTRWQVEIRNIPGDNAFSQDITVDQRSGFEWLAPESYRDRSLMARVRNASCATPGDWTPFQRFSIGASPEAAVSPLACEDYHSNGATWVDELHVPCEAVS